jgi:MSHA pilin protein MshD
MSIRRSLGFTLPELIVLIVVLAIAIAGVMVVFTNTVAGSSNPIVAKQALAIAEAMLDEIQLSSYAPVAGTGVNRQDFNDVLDYNGYATAGGMVAIDGSAIAGLNSYNVAVQVATPGLNGVAEARLIAVTVTGPDNFTLRIEGYKVNFP